MLNPRNVPLLANAVLGVVLVGSLLLLVGAPVEHVLSIADNPVSRVAVVTFVMAFIGVGVLSYAMQLLLHRYREMEAELEEMRSMVEAGHARTTALATTSDEIARRVDDELERVEETLADERERMRAQVRAYLSEGRPTKEVQP